MLDISTARITHFTAAWVGNKNRYEGFVVPHNPIIQLHDIAEEMMLTTILKPFEKTEEFFYLHHEEDPTWNLVHNCCLSIFEAPATSIAYQSNALAQLLYHNCENSRVHGGEFFVAHIEDLILQGEPTSAIALWKIQDKQASFKSERTNQQFELNVLDCIPTIKPQVAAIIFNLDQSEGYRVCAIDTVSKRDERSFWKDEFLRTRPLEDNYFNTRHHVSLTSEFISQKAPIKFDMDRTETIDLLNRTGEYFKENDLFEIEDFAKKLFPELERQESFREFRGQYAAAYAVPLEDSFDISAQAVKREFKVFKSVIRLDKNFHLYVHGRRDLIERGYDEEKGKKYYKVWFENEE